MAGFDLDKQHSFVLPGGGRGEAGRIDFSEASFCQALPTRLLNIYAFMTFPSEDTTGHSKDLCMFENRCTADYDDITSGTIIVKRSSMRYDISASYQYFLAGW